VVIAGHRGDEAAARAGLTDPHPSVRAAALGALARIGVLRLDEVIAGLEDTSPVVRRRACQQAPGVGGRGTRSTLPDALRQALSDPDPLVVESACWALGEQRARRAVGDLVPVAGSHPDIRCREAAVAALGTIGDPTGLVGVLGALTDKPTVRRRATVALAAFGGPEVDEALRRCLADHDWQVRQAAEILLEE
jgi:HEAT repeat protein